MNRKRRASDRTNEKPRRGKTPYQAPERALGSFIKRARACDTNNHTGRLESVTLGYECSSNTLTRCPPCLRLHRSATPLLLHALLPGLFCPSHQSTNTIMSTLFGASGAATTATQQQSSQGDISKDVPLNSPPEDSISEIAFSSQSQHLAVASWDKKVRIYEINQQGQSEGRAAFELDGPVLTTCWSAVSVFHYMTGQNRRWTSKRRIQNAA